MNDSDPRYMEYLRKELNTVWFEADNTAEVRAALVATLPPLVRLAARSIMVSRILDGVGEEYSDRPLEFFMATDDESIASGEEEVRGHSPDWRVIWAETPGGYFCDFNGWPGDNECGAGVLVSQNGHIEWLFDNGDRDLTWRAIPRTDGDQAALGAYAERRDGSASDEPL